VAFNQEKWAQGAFGKIWERLLAPEIYEKVQGPDDAAGEYEGSGLTRVFPKRMSAAGGATSAAFPTSANNISDMAIARRLNALVFIFLFLFVICFDMLQFYLNKSSTALAGGLVSAPALLLFDSISRQMAPASISIGALISLQ
jgi:hypothetical protein